MDIEIDNREFFVTTNFNLSDEADGGLITHVGGGLYLEESDESETDEEFNEGKPVAFLEGSIVRLGHRLNRGRLTRGKISAWVGEVDSVELEEVMSYLTQKADDCGSFSAKILNALGDDEFVESCPAVFYVDSIKVDPKYRKHNLGLKLFHDFIYTVGNICPSGLVICVPAPIENPEGGVTRNEAVNKLRKYWSQLGLVKLPSSSYYAMRCWRLKKIPNISFHDEC